MIELPGNFLLRWSEGLTSSCVLFLSFLSRTRADCSRDCQRSRIHPHLDQFEIDANDQGKFIPLFSCSWTQSGDSNLQAYTDLFLSLFLLILCQMVPRGTSSTADAYLTPVLQAYIDGFFSGFDESLRDGSAGTRVEFMMSDGGLTSVQHFSGLKSIISGPAGGVVGMALTSWDETDSRPIIGLDMGGTSTDVSRFAGRYEQVFETTLAGVTIQSPQLE